MYALFITQVYEMWAQGERVGSGIIKPETKIVFRSSTSMVYLFMQMSSEMWDFDINGDLYFEKAVYGFLADLFEKWKKHGCNHDVTVVLFSRTFYKAHVTEDFPEHMRECLQQDYKGRFYEDFYRVAVQNERYDDWSSILVELKRIFSQYNETVMNYHKRPGVEIPEVCNSTASQGNFLEVLNMSLNVFERHFIDRSLDRTGQLSVVITPGVGVFEVDRELANVTKQRIIDSVKDICTSKGHYCHDENMQSLFDYNAYDAEIFKYGANAQNNSNKFTDLNKSSQHKKSLGTQNKISGSSNMIWRKMSEDKTVSGAVDLQDLPVINIPTVSIDHSHPSMSFGALSIEGQWNSPVLQSSPHSSCKDDFYAESLKSPLSPPSNQLIVGSCGVVSEGSFMQKNTRSKNNSGNTRQSRALINPFDPSHLTIKLTSNRRRWTHVFPIGPKGGFMQEHHRKAQLGKPSILESDVMSDAPMSPKQEVVQATQKAVEKRKLRVAKFKLLHAYSDAATIASSSDFSLLKKRSQTFRTASQIDPDPKNLLLVWGATGEQEWSPGLTTGVDWKSLTFPACLPITIDYFPDNESLKNDFVLSNYSLQPEDITSDFAPVRVYDNEGETTNVKMNVMSAKELFKELVLQRLQQNFQIILLTKEQLKNLQDLERNCRPQFLPEDVNSDSSLDNCESYFLSIGRIFHKISLTGPIITVTQYRPRHPYPQINVHYRYRFQAPDNKIYGVSSVHFTTQLLENYVWNYVDHYITGKGEGEYPIKDTFNYWRINVAVLPSFATATTRKIIDEGLEYCDIYVPNSDEQQQLALIEGFTKFVEIMNKIRRPTNSCQQNLNLSSSRQTSTKESNQTTPVLSSQASSVPGYPQNQPPEFRDRVCSNRVHDRPRSKSGVKNRERMRSESGNFPSGPVSSTVDQIQNSDSIRSLSSNDSQGEAMLSNPDLTENNALSFLMKHPGLPPWSFLSCEAVTWAISNIDGVNDIADAIKLFEDMRSSMLLIQASEDPDHPFINGFYIYFFVPPDYSPKPSDSTEFETHVKQFEKKWFEIEFLQHTEGKQNGTTQCLRTQPYFESQGSATVYNIFEEKYIICPLKKLLDLPPKLTTIELDGLSNKDRLEWGCASYDYIYNPTHAFEIIIKWMVATGTVLSDFLSMWQRKAATHGLQLIPIPSNPFAIPFSGKSDPLRGPVFVPLKLDCIVKNRGKTHLFEEYPHKEKKKRLVLFQETIVQKFGFIPIQCKLMQTTGRVQFIHVSGGMFVMITKTTKKDDSKYRSQDYIKKHATKSSNSTNPANLTTQDTNAHEAYVTRHVTARSSNPTNPTNQVGFLWSWNHMLSKRWRSQSTGETHFQDKVLADFTRFCANSDERLEKFWDGCHVACST
ncbi:GATOR complex protein DEPDC5 [Nymphon striatum]|nr:GATOR complex protein DEPDC5 [Nymphon striatum]